MTRSELDEDQLGKAARKANAEWMDAMKTGDASTIAAPYADDAVFIMIDGKCIQGQTEIEQLYRARFEHSGIATSASIDLKKLVVDGDLAYELGYGETEVVREGKLSKTGSRYLTVWQRKADGEWKIIRNIILP